jgi:hypothetical protein
MRCLLVHSFQTALAVFLASFPILYTPIAKSQRGRSSLNISDGMHAVSGQCASFLRLDELPFNVSNLIDVHAG